MRRSPGRGAKPATRLMERAREARYRLLGAHAGTSAPTPSPPPTTSTIRRRRSCSGSCAARASRASPAWRPTRARRVALVRPLLGSPRPTSSPSAAPRRRLRRGPVQRRSGLRPHAPPPAAGRARRGRPRRRGFRPPRPPRGGSRRALERDDGRIEARLGTGPDRRQRAALRRRAVVHRMLARRIAAVGGREESRIGLEKIEALAQGLAAAASEGEAFAANVGGALVIRWKGPAACPAGAAARRAGRGRNRTYRPGTAARRL